MQRNRLWILISFLLGIALTYGLIHLDREASIHRLKDSERFEVALPDGEVRLVSYAQVDEERKKLEQELAGLRKQMETFEKRRPLARGIPPFPLPGAFPGTGPEQPAATASPDKPASGPDAPTTPEVVKKDLGDLLAKIFNQPMMKELVQGQSKRRADELAAVLDLTTEQRDELEEAFRVRQQMPRSSSRVRQPPSGNAVAGEPPPPGNIEEDIRSILSPEQYNDYQEYTAKKKALARAPQADKDLLELTWRLSLTEEQESPVREVLQEHWSKIKDLSPERPPAGGVPDPGEIEKQMQERSAVNEETAARMKEILDEEQLQDYLKYQQDKLSESRFFERFIQGQTPQQ